MEAARSEEIRSPALFAEAICTRQCRFDDSPSLLALSGTREGLRIGTGSGRRSYVIVVGQHFPVSVAQQLQALGCMPDRESKLALLGADDRLKGDEAILFCVACGCLDMVFRVIEGATL